MQTIEYWEVSESYDRDTKHIANFMSEQVAKDFVGENLYQSVYKRTLTIFDSVIDFQDNTREKIRARALAKLTTEERIALGLK